MLEVVSIPAFDGSVLTGREEHVGIGNEPYRHYAVIVGKD